MTTSDHVWMTRRAYIRLQAELASLQAQPKLEVPEDIMDHDANRIAASRAHPARIRRIEHLLANAVVGEDPLDDGVAEPGMVVTVRHEETGETETFLLGVRGTETAEVEVYSPHSSLGRAITGAHPGDRRTHPAAGGKELEVTLLRAIPYGRYARGGGRRVHSGHAGSRSTGRVLSPR
jgi:transcription elongation factor GreA